MDGKNFRPCDNFAAYLTVRTLDENFTKKWIMKGAYFIPVVLLYLRNRLK